MTSRFSARVGVFFSLAIAAGSLASAQAVSHRPQVSVGTEWMGGSSFGTATASELTSTGAGYPLFSSSNELGGAGGVNVRIGTRLTRLFSVEAAGSYSRPVLRSITSADVEGTPGVTATERLRQFTIEGVVLFTHPRWHVGSQGSPFVFAGIGYLKQVHEGDTLGVDGRIYSAGAGLKLPLVRNRGHLDSLGIRADLRLVVRTQGVSLDGHAHASPALGGSAYFQF